MVKFAGGFLGRSLDRSLGCCLGAAAILALATAPASAHWRHHHHHYYYGPLFSYLHNYGPGPVPGTYAYYDGPLRVNCKQSAAMYRGQDGRAHPCF